MTGKMPLEWHKKNQANAERWLREEKQRVRNEVRRFYAMCADVKFRAEQIAAAEKRGKDGFDAEKFMVVRKKKVAA